jgi:hypothetical protein
MSVLLFHHLLQALVAEDVVTGQSLNRCVIVMVAVLAEAAFVVVEGVV